MNLVGGGEGCVGVAGRVETRVCTGRVMEPGILMMLGARVALPPPWAAWERVSVGRGCTGEESQAVGRAPDQMCLLPHLGKRGGGSSTTWVMVSVVRFTC